MTSSRAALALDQRSTINDQRERVLNLLSATCNCRQFTSRVSPPRLPPGSSAARIDRERAVPIVERARVVFPRTWIRPRLLRTTSRKAASRARAPAQRGPSGTRISDASADPRFLRDSPASRGTAGGRHQHVDRADPVPLSRCHAREIEISSTRIADTALDPREENVLGGGEIGSSSQRDRVVEERSRARRVRVDRVLKCLERFVRLFPASEAARRSC